MTSKIIKRGLLITGSVLLLFILVIAIHVYMVTRPKAPDEHTMVMARMDFNQSLTDEDSVRITAWLYQEKGIDHVLCNPAAKLAVFTFFAKQTSANKVISDLNAALPYQAIRYLPSEEAMKTGCPVASSSFSYMAYQFFKNLF